MTSPGPLDLQTQFVLEHHYESALYERLIQEEAKEILLVCFSQKLAEEQSFRTQLKDVLTQFPQQES